MQRVTIPGDRTQHPKGYAYVEFLEPEAVENALKLEGSEVGSRPIKVARKRTNEAGAVRGRGGRFGRGRGRGLGRAFGMMPMPMMFDPSMMMCAPPPPPRPCTSVCFVRCAHVWVLFAWAREQFVM